MAQWVRLCSRSEAPESGGLREFQPAGISLCVANSGGALAAVDNVCPHRGGPMSEGWLENGKVVCPWHAWAFDLHTGDCPEERSRIRVYPLRMEGDDVLVDTEPDAARID